MLRSLSILCLTITTVNFTASMPGSILTNQTQTISLPVLQDFLDSDPPSPPINGGSRVSPFS
jgi:hypothetical protein